MEFLDSREFSARMDREDPLGDYRGHFNFPRHRNGLAPVYLCGNSLGLQPKKAVEYLEDELKNWRDYAVDGHFHSGRPWISYHRHCVAGFTELTGAKASEVVAMNTLTVNLHLMMASFYRPTPERCKIVIESHAFPSDRYAAASQIRMHGFNPESDLLEWSPRSGETRLHTDDLAAMLDEHGDSIALLLLPGVQYYTGQVLDMEAICDLGREHGCAVGLDLAHAIGNVEMHLHDWSPDFASWCTYKYLNGGPGSIAGAFVAERHCSRENLQQLHGWWGHDEATRFKMAKDFTPAAGAELWQMSNPPILALAPVAGALTLFEEVGIAALRTKSRLLTGFMDWLVAERYGDRIGSITPRDARGCQLSLVVKDKSINARELFDRLSELNVTPDWREPDVIRVAPVPLYNSFDDVFEFAERLGTALTDA
ncbi:MAG TPA: kynureninase [Woeseiaceae bacterium]|nr:kynureninase [Woeseiaceae bacterium]